jgi:hypothetical protein
MSSHDADLHLDKGVDAHGESSCLTFKALTSVCDQTPSPFPTRSVSAPTAHPPLPLWHPTTIHPSFASMRRTRLSPLWATVGHFVQCLQMRCRCSRMMRCPCCDPIVNSTASPAPHLLDPVLYKNVVLHEWA